MEVGIAIQHRSSATFSGKDRTTSGVFKKFSCQQLCIAKHFFKLAALSNGVRLLAESVLAVVTTS